MNHLTILEILEMEALNGNYETNLRLWKRTIESLRKKGLNVTILYEICTAKYYCNITWKQSKPNTDNKETYTIANNLWLMANKVSI